MEPITIIFAIAAPVALITLLVAVLSYLYYSGWFQQIEIDVATPPVRNLEIMYQFGTGPFHKASNILDALTKVAPDEDYVVIYYDDENEVAAEKLRWAVGVILAEGEETMDEKVKHRLEAAGCRRHSLPCAKLAVLTEVDLTTRLSYRFVIQKVYPKMDEYMQNQDLDAEPVMEIYEDDTLFIMAPLDNQKGFYVPEACRRR